MVVVYTTSQCLLQQLLLVNAHDPRAGPPVVAIFWFLRLSKVCLPFLALLPGHLTRQQRPVNIVTKKRRGSCDSRNKTHRSFHIFPTDFIAISSQSPSHRTFLVGHVILILLPHLAFSTTPFSIGLCTVCDCRKLQKMCLMLLP
jgi:hypothetical protein